jgi:Fic family protein
MDMVFEHSADLAMTENYIKQIHRELLRHSGKDAYHRGEYKKFPNNVEAFDGAGKSLGVVFETTSPFDTQREMEDLVRWTRKTLDDESLHPLMVVGVFAVVFLAIHPFQDGNGRLSRVLTSLLLLRAGYSYIPDSSL